MISSCSRVTSRRLSLGRVCGGASLSTGMCMLGRRGLGASLSFRMFMLGRLCGGLRVASGLTMMSSPLVMRLLDGGLRPGHSLYA